MIVGDNAVGRGQFGGIADNSVCRVRVSARGSVARSGILISTVSVEGDKCSVDAWHFLNHTQH